MKLINAVLGAFIKAIFSYIERRKEKTSEKEKKALKERLLRYFEAGQNNSHGSFYQTKAMLLRDHLFEPKDFGIISQLLTDLVRDGFLEYSGGSYYLAGRAPKF